MTSLNWSTQACALMVLFGVKMINFNPTFINGRISLNICVTLFLKTDHRHCPLGLELAMCRDPFVRLICSSIGGERSRLSPSFSHHMRDPTYSPFDINTSEELQLDTFAK